MPYHIDLNCALWIVTYRGRGDQVPGCVGDVSAKSDYCINPGQSRRGLSSHLATITIARDIIPLEEQEDCKADDFTTFNSTLVLSFNASLYTPTADDLFRFEEAFRENYNKLSRSEESCDPLSRFITTVTAEFTDEFEFNRRLQSTVNDLDFTYGSPTIAVNSTESPSTDSPSDAQTLYPRFRGSFFANEYFVFVIGTCRGCSQETNLFSNDVSGRRVLAETMDATFSKARESSSASSFSSFVEIDGIMDEKAHVFQTQNENINRLLEGLDDTHDVADYECLCPISSENQGPTKEALNQVLKESLGDDVADDSLIRFIEVDPVPCPSTVDSFATEITLPFVVRDENALSEEVVQGLEACFINSYNLLIQGEFCDPLFRTVEDVAFRSSVRLDSTQSLVTFDILGRCRGCEPDSPLFEEFSRRLGVNDNARTKLADQLIVNDLLSENADDTCYCEVNTVPGSTAIYDDLEESFEACVNSLGSPAISSPTDPPSVSPSESPSEFPSSSPTIYCYTEDREGDRCTCPITVSTSDNSYCSASSASFEEDFKLNAKNDRDPSYSCLEDDNCRGRCYDRPDRIKYRPGWGTWFLIDNTNGASDITVDVGTDSGWHVMFYEGVCGEELSCALEDTFNIEDYSYSYDGGQGPSRYTSGVVGKGQSVYAVVFPSSRKASNISPLDLCFFHSDDAPIYASAPYYSAPSYSYPVAAPTYGFPVY
jgi:hypothetical protein